MPAGHADLPVCQHSIRCGASPFPSWPGAIPKGRNGTSQAGGALRSANPLCRARSIPRLSSWRLDSTAFVLACQGTHRPSRHYRPNAPGSPVPSTSPGGHSPRADWRSADLSCLRRCRLKQEAKSGHERDKFWWESSVPLPRLTEVTDLLKAWSNGDQGALDLLTAKVYRELHVMARRYMRNERAANTLQTSALINEVYLRLVDVQSIEWKQRAQFFGVAAQMMRRILVDAARARGSDKRAEEPSRFMWTMCQSWRRNATHRSWPWTKHWRPSQSWLLAKPKWSSCAISAG